MPSKYPCPRCRTSRGTVEGVCPKCDWYPGITSAPSTDETGDGSCDELAVPEIPAPVTTTDCDSIIDDTASPFPESVGGTDDSHSAIKNHWKLLFLLFWLAIGGPIFWYLVPVIIWGEDLWRFGAFVGVLAYVLTSYLEVYGRIFAATPMEVYVVDMRVRIDSDNQVFHVIQTTKGTTSVRRRIYESVSVGVNYKALGFVSFTQRLHTFGEWTPMDSTELALHCCPECGYEVPTNAACPQCAFAARKSMLAQNRGRGGLVLFYSLVLGALLFFGWPAYKMFFP